MQGRMYNMTTEDAHNASDVVRGSDANPLYWCLNLGLDVFDTLENKVLYKLIFWYK